MISGLLFLVPKPNNKWKPILDLNCQNKYLKSETLKMETPETIRTSVQTGDWVLSIDLKETLFYIPIHTQSRKYMCFHLQVSPINSKHFHLVCPQNLCDSPFYPEVKFMAFFKPYTESLNHFFQSYITVSCDFKVFLLEMSVVCCICLLLNY